MSFEALSYVFLLWLWVILRNHLRVAGAIACAAVLTTLFPWFYKSMPGIAYTLPYFASGVVMYVIYERLGTTNSLAYVSLGFLCASFFTEHPKYAFAIFGSYLVIHLAQRLNLGSRFARRWGDLSYGLYLFGWPVESLLKQATNASSGWELAAYSLPFALGVAALSWWVIERPCLVLKRVV